MVLLYSEDRRLDKLENLLNYSSSHTNEKIKLLVYQDYGFGDMVQFLRYIPLLSDSTDKLGLLIKGNFYEPWVEAAAEPPSFKWLITEQYGSHLDDTLIDGWNSVPKYYTHKIEFMDLANIYPVIKPDVWHISNEKPKCLEQISVGYCLSGSKGHPNDKYRSIEKIHFSKFINTFKDRVNFVDLSQEALRQKYGCFTIQDTVKIIKSLDLVISVDTLIVHLAGYCQIPIFLLHGSVNDNRWHNDEWYNNVTHFYQGKNDEWGNLINTNLTKNFSDWWENCIGKTTEKLSESKKRD